MAAVATPPDVLAVLNEAFGGGLIGETGYEIAAAQCTSAAEKAEAKQRGSSLLYGELLPDGVSKAISPTRLGGPLVAPGAVVLELGMGSGKVAMQVFLQCPCVSHVLGVELVPSRYAIAASALRQLAGRRPQAFREVAAPRVSGPEGDLEASCLETTPQSSPSGASRRLEFCCADFFARGLDLVPRTDAIFFAVHIPCKLFPDLCRALATAKEGCRLFSYHSLDSIWWSEERCPFRKVPDNVPESDTFSTSWSPQGYRFHVYVCDRAQDPPEIAAGMRNETFSEWEAKWDEASKAYFYHNAETEESQWEVPVQAGCWRAEWSAEHGCHFYWHMPSSHSQWEVPKCLADVGWVYGN